MDQTFSRLSTNLQEQSQKWTQACDRCLAEIDLKHHHTNDCRQFCHVRLSIVDCVFSKTQTLVKTLKIRNQPQKKSYVSLEAEHLFPSVRCARNKRQYPTVLQNLRSFLWMLDCAWMDYLLSTSGTWYLRCCIQQTTLKYQSDQLQENWCGTGTHSGNITKTKTPAKHTFFSRRVSVVHF